MGKKTITLLLLCAIGAAMAGCQPQIPPDPNDPTRVAPQDRAATLHKTIKLAADFLNERVQTGQITDQDRLDLLSQKAAELLSYADFQHCRPEDAWIYGDLLITAHRFKDAVPVLQKAVKYAQSTNNDDRRVNDSLRLARALANTGQTAESLKLVQSIIDSNPKDPGPVLPAVLLEITPAAQGKGHDEQLARILEESIHLHLKEKVDPKSIPGQMFLVARSHHIRNAWITIINLLAASGHPAQAAAAEARATQMMSTLSGVSV